MDCSGSWQQVQRNEPLFPEKKTVRCELFTGFRKDVERDEWTKKGVNEHNGTRQPLVADLLATCHGNSEQSNREGNQQRGGSGGGSFHWRGLLWHPKGETLLGARLIELSMVQFSFFPTVVWFFCAYGVRLLGTALCVALHALIRVTFVRVTDSSGLNNGFLMMMNAYGTWELY